MLGFQENSTQIFSWKKEIREKKKGSPYISKPLFKTKTKHGEIKIIIKKY